MSTSNLDLQKLPIPSIERPFGIHLWPIFDKVFTTIAGFHPEDFDFKPRVTPMSTLKHAGLTIVAYYIVILGGRELMRSRPAFQLNTLFKIHNFYLTVISGVLLALFVEELGKLGVDDLACLVPARLPTFLVERIDIGI